MNLGFQGQEISILAQPQFLVCEILNTPWLLWSGSGHPAPVRRSAETMALSDNPAIRPSLVPEAGCIQTEP